MAEWKEKIDSIQAAIQQLIHEKDQQTNSSLDESFIAVVDDGDDGRHDDHRRVLANLLSQLESLKAEGKLQQPDPSINPTESLSPAAAGNLSANAEAVGVADEGSSRGSEQESIVKELKKLKKQNFITHCLLSAMIVLTVAWQFSEVALILRLKDRVSHPFKSVGNIIEGVLKGQNKNLQDGEEDQCSIKPKLLTESSSFPGLKIPDLPKAPGLPDFSSNGNRN